MKKAAFITLVLYCYLIDITTAQAQKEVVYRNFTTEQERTFMSTFSLQYASKLAASHYVAQLLRWEDSLQTHHKYTTGLQLNSTLLQFSKKQKLTQFFAIIHWRMSRNLSGLNQLEQAAAACYQALQHAPTLLLKSKIYNSLGVIQYKLGDLEKAKRYYLQSYRLKKRLKVAPKTLVVSLNNTGTSYLELNRFDSAVYYFKEAVAISKKHTLGPGVEIPLYNNLAQSYNQQGQYEEAYLYLTACLAYFPPEESQIPPNEGKVYTLINLGVNRALTKQLDKAIAHLEEALHLAITLRNIHLQQLVLENLQDAYKDNQNYLKAYESFKQFHLLQDSLAKKEKVKAIAELETQYETQLKQKQITSLRKTNQHKDSQLHQKNLLNGILLVALGLFSILVVIIFLGRNKLKKASEAIALSHQEIDKRNQQLLKANQQLEVLHKEKDHLMEIVAHDLKAPLNNIGHLADLVSSAAADHHRRQQYLQMIQSEKQRGNVLINDMLTSPLLEKEHASFNLAPVKLNLLFAHRISHFEAYALKKQISLSFERTNLPIIYSDPEALTRILDNLLSNAIKFSSPQQFVILKLWQQGEQAFFSVADQGPGFSHQDKKHLFEKFKRLSAVPTGSEASSGLGLSIVKDLVDSLGGTIRLESEVGQGAKFTVSIPINHGEAEST